MDSLDIVNTLVLKQDDLPAPVKEIFSRMEVGDKVTFEKVVLTLTENGEKIVSLAINEGDSLTIKDPSNPDAEPVTFELGEGDDEDAEPEPDDDKKEGEEDAPSAAVESVKNAAQPEDEDEPAGEK